MANRDGTFSCAACIRKILAIMKDFNVAAATASQIQVRMRVRCVTVRVMVMRCVGMRRRSTATIPPGLRMKSVVVTSWAATFIASIVIAHWLAVVRSMAIVGFAACFMDAAWVHPLAIFLTRSALLLGNLAFTIALFGDRVVAGAQR